MSHLHIYENPLDASTITVEQTDNVLKRFLEVKVKFPQARIYKNVPCTENDVTPVDKVTAFKLLDAGPEDQFHIVCHAGEPITIAYAIIAVIAIATAVYVYTNMPSLKNDSSSTGSPNNKLSDRENQQRIGQRVADIFGKRKSIPDLIAPSYRIFQDNLEVEESFMCIGRGFYEIDPNTIKEGDTIASTISGSSYSIYEPSQNITASPQLQHGASFDTPPLVTRKCNAVNGQTFVPPFQSKAQDDDIYFKYPNQIKAVDSWTREQFTERFIVGQEISIQGANWGQADIAGNGSATVDATLNTISIVMSEVSNAESYQRINILTYVVNDPVNGSLDLSGTYDIESISYAMGSYTITLIDPASTNSNFSQITENLTATLSGLLINSTVGLNLDGTYVISGIDGSSETISLVDPGAINSSWNDLQYEPNGETEPYTKYIYLRSSQNNWIGWYSVDFAKATGILLNFVAPNGITRGSEDKHVEVTVEYQQVVNGSATGPIFSETVMLHGIDGSRSQIAKTLRIDMPFTGAFRFRAKRITDNGDHADLSDDTKFYLAYAFYESDKLIYDDVTLARVRTVATQQATGAQSREFNLIAHRKLYSYQSGEKSVDRIATSNFADIVCAMTTDEKIGRRDINTLDVASLYAVADEINTYFGVSIEFNYTFDDAKISYEEALATVANAVFCDARRESNQVFFVFEQPRDIPTLLFNHRNKKPESEKRSVSFGVNKDFDGVKIKWHNPADSWSETEIKLPNDNMINAKSLEISGITNEAQAKLLAYRALNKLKHKKRSVEFSAYHEADLVTRNDLILVADDTRPMLVSSGSVIEQDGLYLTLSQPCVLDENETYVIHLQLPNRQVDVIQLSQGDHEREVLLARAPTSQLVVEYEGNISCSTYLVTTDTHSKRDLFLITEKSGGGGESSITAINYTDQYYLNDKDYV